MEVFTICTFIFSCCMLLFAVNTLVSEPFYKNPAITKKQFFIVFFFWPFLLVSAIFTAFGAFIKWSIVESSNVSEFKKD